VATGFPVATLFARYPRPILILVLASVGVPLVLFPEFFFPYVTTRALYFRAVLELGLGGVFYVALRDRRRVNVTGDPVFLALLAFVAISGLSAVLSPAPARSFYGNFERMGGVWAWLHWLLYYILLRTVLDEKGWTIFFRLAVAVSAIVSLFGLREVVAVIAMHPHASLPAVSSTIGNSGLLAPYLLFGVAFAALLALRRDKFLALYVGAGALDLMVIGLSQNRSTMIGILLGVICGASCYAVISRTASRRRVLYVALALVTLVVAAGIVERVTPHGRVSQALPTVLERAGHTSQESEAPRLIQWRVALEGFRDHPLLGIGPENHTLLWTRYFDSRALHSDPTSIYDRAHNGFLEVLSTTGILGFASFLGIWISLLFTIRRAWRSGSMSPAELSLLLGALVAYATYLFFWFTDVNSTPLWIALGAYLVTRQSRTPLLSPDMSRKPTRLILAGCAIGLIAVCATLYLHVVEPLRVAHALNLVQRRDISLQVGANAIDVIFDSRGPQKSFSVLSSGGYLASLAPKFPALRANPSDSALMDRAFAKAIVGSSREVGRDSLNDRLRIEYARLLLVAGQFYKNSNFSRAGVLQIERAIELSPNRISSRIILANVFAQMGDYPRALASARTTTLIDPTLGEAHYEVARIYLLAGQPDSAAAELRRSLDLNFVRVSDAYLTTGGQLEREGRTSVAARIYVAYLDRRFGKSIWTGKPLPDIQPERQDVRLAAHLPLVFLSMNELDNARLSANALTSLDGRLKSVVAGFDSTLAANRGESWRGKFSLLGCLSRAESATQPQSVAECENFPVKSVPPTGGR